jgi:UDP-N-acetylglucosamine 4-epimerase
VHRDARTGDVRHALADVSRARRVLSYEAVVTAREGLARAAEWYRKNLDSRPSA